MVTSTKIKRVVMIAPRSTGGNFEYVAIPRQGLLFLSGALEQWEGEFLYERDIWYEDRSGLIDPDKDLEGADILMVTALINEAPRAYEIARSAKEHHPNIRLLGGGPLDLSRSYSVHLWSHLWWSFDRRDFSARHAGEMSVANLRTSHSPLAELVRPYLPDIDVDDLRT